MHSDLHDDQTLNAVNFLASSLLWITQDIDQKHSGKNPNYFRGYNCNEYCKREKLLICN